MTFHKIFLITKGKSKVTVEKPVVHHFNQVINVNIIVSTSFVSIKSVVWPLKVCQQLGALLKWDKVFR